MIEPRNTQNTRKIGNKAVVFRVFRVLCGLLKEESA